MSDMSKYVAAVSVQTSRAITYCFYYWPVNISLLLQGQLTLQCYSHISYDILLEG